MAKSTIQSKQFGCFLRMDAPDLSYGSDDGGGIVNCQTPAQKWEAFDVIELDDETVNIASIQWPGYFLRMDGSGVSSFNANGEGVVNCQNSAGPWEKFKLVPQSDGSLAIASVAFPGVYLRMDGTGAKTNPDGSGTVNCQYYAGTDVGAFEKFFIINNETSLSHADVRQAIIDYGPTLVLDRQDPYRMCTIDWFLQHSTLVNTQTDEKIVSPTMSQLPTASSTETNSNTIYHLNLQQTAIYGNQDKTVKAYVRAFWEPGLPYTDLQFWFIYAFNGPSILDIKLPGISSFQIDIQPLGTHPGDIEYCVIRIDNNKKKMIGIFMSQHDTSQSLIGSDLDQLERVPGKDNPIVYSARNTHAVFPHKGNNPYGGWQTDVTHYSIANNCDGEGPKLDCSQSYEIVSVSWSIKPQEPNWVNYPSRWGYITNLSPPTFDQLLQKVQEKIHNKITALAIAEAIYFRYQFQYVVGQDLEGPEGPRYKEQWHGVY